MFKVTTEFIEATEMSYVIISGVYQDIIFGLKLSSMGMEGRFKAGLSQSTIKGLFNNS